MLFTSGEASTIEKRNFGFNLISFDLLFSNQPFQTGVCNGPPYTGEACGFDGGDCDACFASKGDLISGLNDLYCDIELNTTECGYDGGDCLEYLNPRMSCSVEDKSKLGDGVCDGEEYNTEECEWDYLDCALCNEEVPNHKKIGNGHCDGGLYMKLSVCAEDAGVSVLEAKYSSTLDEYY